MEDTRPDLSITIVSFNTKDLTRQTLQSIYDNTRSASFEIFVVDNASPDGSADMIEQEFPKVNVIRNDVNKGLAAATNQGLEKSAGRYVLALNSDVVVQPEAFDVLVHFMDEHPDAGGAIPKLVLPDGGAHPMFCGKAPTFKVEMMDALGALHSSIAEAVPTARVGMEIDISKTQEVPCILWGTSFIVRREVLETVGPQDPTFFVYSEDVDWSMRIAKAGWKQYYVSEACVIHLAVKAPSRLGRRCPCSC
jgi:GT2 family glycosyltransferase